MDKASWVQPELVFLEVITVLRDCNETHDLYIKRCDRSPARSGPIVWWVFHPPSFCSEYSLSGKLQL